MSKIAIVITSICLTLVATAVIVVAVSGVADKNNQNNVVEETVGAATSTDIVISEGTTVAQENDERKESIELPSDKSEGNVAQTEQISKESEKSPIAIDESESESEELKTEETETYVLNSGSGGNNYNSSNYVTNESAQEETTKASTNNNSGQINPENYSYEDLMEADGNTLKQIVDACGSYEEYMKLLAEKESSSNVKTLEGTKESEASGTGSGISFKK